MKYFLSSKICYLVLFTVFFVPRLQAQINVLPSPNTGWLVEQDNANITNSVSLPTNIATYKVPAGGASISFNVGFNNANRQLNPGCCNGNSTKQMIIRLYVNGVQYWQAASPSDDNNVSADNTVTNGASFSQGSGNIGIGTYAYNDASNGRTPITIKLPASLTSINSIQFQFVNGYGNSPDDDGAIIVNSLLMIPCSAGATAPTISSSNNGNVCPATSVNLTNLVTSSTPSGSSLVWFTNSSHTGTAYSTPSLASTGTYYAFYYDSINNCYSPASTAVNVTIAVCCSGGTVGPQLNSTSASNNCPVGTVNLNNLISSSTPSGASLVWFTNNSHTGTTYNTPTAAATSGTYYAYYYDSVNNCYSPASAGLVLSITSCPTMDCSLTQIIPAPTQGIASQLDLVVTMNITALPSVMSPTVSNTGFTLAIPNFSITPIRTGIQQFHIPVNYDGSVLGSLTVAAGSVPCIIDLTKGIKRVVINVTQFNNCITIAPGMLIK